MAGAKKMLALLLFIGLIVLGLTDSPQLHARDFGVYQFNNTKASESFVDGDGSYYDYLDNYPANYPDEIIEIDYLQPISATDNNMTIENDTINTSDEGSITWAFAVHTSGFYYLNFEYYPLAGKGVSIQRTLMIDGIVPFTEASVISFYRLWRDKGPSTFQDDNEVRPSQIEAPDWINYNLADRSKLIDGDYMFYLAEGNHTLTLNAIREPLGLRKMNFVPVTVLPDYDEVLSIYDTQGLEEIKLSSPLQIEGEKASLKSSPSLYAITDNSSPLTSPHHTYKIRLNVIGGTNYQTVGDFIEWETDVEEEGLYEISIRYLQNDKIDLPTVRSLYVNGKIPFAECAEIEFPYTTHFKMLTVGDGERSYLFHLHKGKNTIRLETTLGRYRVAMNEIQQIIDELNDLYRRIIVVTGVTPDINRDYELTKYIPELKSELTYRREDISRVINMLLASSDKKTSETVILNKLYDQLTMFINNTYVIASNISLFQANISALGTCLNELMTQPLKIDYLLINDATSKLPRGEGNFFERLWFGLQKLVVSFFVDYDSLGSVSTDGANIEVWVMSGRDQAQIIKNLIISEFTPNSNIGVAIKVVSSGSLLPNTLIGRGPDIAMMIGSDLPVQYAFRNAVYDLTQFADFEEVVSDRFYESSLLNLTYNGGVYGLPETAQAPMLFYREDIIVDQFGLDIPQTWDELIDDIAVLQRSNLDIFFGTPGNVNSPDVIDQVYASMLMQRGGYFYQSDLQKTALNEEVAINTFIDWTKIFTQHSAVVSANFLNRFRSGQMPIGISDYSFSNNLAMFAPEIDGRWKMAPLPGTIDENGTLKRDAFINGTALTMIKRTKNPNAAWEFMKWWTSTETQLTYGREVEAVLGRAARYQTANKNAIDGLAWQKDELSAIKEQLSFSRGLDQVPGGTYMTGRQINNAFRKVINNNMNPRETFLSYLPQIDIEISYKRKEFNLD